MKAQKLLSDRKISWVLSDVGIQKRANLKRQSPRDISSSTSKKRKYVAEKDVEQIIVEAEEMRDWIVLSLHSGTLKCKDLHNALAKVLF